MAPDKHSTSYDVFEAHCRQVMNLVTNTLAPLSSTVHETAESTPVIKSSVSEIIARIAAVGTAPSSEAQGKVDSITADLQQISKLMQPLHQSVNQIADLMHSTAFLYTWMIVMLVTFTEAYIEDALNILICSGFSSTSLPSDISAEMKKRWVRDILRAGKPTQWIKAFEQFGATGYDGKIPDQLTLLWKRRHTIVHSASPNPSTKITNEVFDAIALVSAFVETTDAFIVSSCPNA
jgi:hypothetical protein